MVTRLSLETYLMGRDKLYPDEWNSEFEANALVLIRQVNSLLEALSWGPISVSSGWRPLAINTQASGAKRSLHLIGKAVDIVDKEAALKRAILERTELLKDFALWLEHPDSTPGWAHLDTCTTRTDRPIRIFKP